MQFLKLVIFTIVMLALGGIANGQTVIVGPNSPTGTAKIVAQQQNVKSSGKGVRIAYFDNSGNMLDSNGNIIKAVLGYTPADSSKVVFKSDSGGVFVTPSQLAGKIDTTRISQNLSDSNNAVVPSNGAVDRALAPIRTTLNNKQDKISESTQINIPNFNNTRNDASAVVYRKGWYYIFYNHFYGAAGDLGGASVAVVRTQNFLTFQDTAVIVPSAWFGGATVAVPNVYTDPRNGTVRLFFYVNKSLVLSDTAKVALYKRELPYNADPYTGWTDTVKVIDNNRRDIGAPDRLLDVGQEMYGTPSGYLIIPFCFLVSGTGNSGSSIYNGGVYKSYDYGATWTTGSLNISAGSTLGVSLVDEPGMYYIPKGGWWYYFRTLSGEVRRVSMGYDTSFTTYSRITTLMPAQNAQSTFKYFARQKLVVGGVMRQQMRTSSNNNRQFLDLALSDDNYNFTYENVFQVDSTANQLNEPTIYFADSLQSLIYIYTRSYNGVAYSGLSCHIYPYSLLSKPQMPSVVPKLNIFANQMVTGEDNTMLTLGTARIVTDSASRKYKNMSANSNSDATQFAILQQDLPTNTTVNGIERYNNISGANVPIGIESGSTGGELLYINKNAVKDTRGRSGNTVMSVYNNGLLIPNAQDNGTSSLPVNNVVRGNADRNKIQGRMNNSWYDFTENYFYEVRGSSFAADSTYTDTSLRSKYISIFWNNSSKYLIRDTDYTLNNGVIKLKRQTPTSADFFIIRTEAQFISGLVPQYFPLDTIGVPYMAASFRQLYKNYTGFSCRLTSLIDASFIDVGFTPQGGLDTFSINNWSGKDSCYISMWYNQGSSTNIFTHWQSITIPQGVRFRKVAGEVYAEFNGTSYLQTNATTTSSFPFLHDGTKSVTVNTVFMPTNVGTTTVYALMGNNNGTTTARGMYLVYDNRSAQSSTNALSLVVSNGTNNQPPINAKYNTTGITNNTKGLYFGIYNPSLATASARSSQYVNAGTASQTNTNTFTPSATVGAANSFQLGTTGTTRYQGRMYEFILYDSALTDNQRTALRNNQRTYFNVY